VERYVCIHGHFYQPPRENPWLETVEVQDSAYPYHDWNERVTAECYAPNTASRLVDGEGRILAVVNNYSRISYNVGPTLLAWMQEHAPETYERILESDKLSAARFSGHGSAMAQAYNHLIMPLANSRDKRTQVIWGIRDFQKRFGRDPEGMWLPETAVDLETLEVLAEQGIKFTLLSPRQAKSFRQKGEPWESVEGEKIDPTTAYLCALPSGRTINLFFFDGPISREVAFGDLLQNGEAFAQRLIGAFSEGREWPQLVSVATDGETYGHHHPFGDMALAYCLHVIESGDQVTLTNYGEFLEHHPPTREVQCFDGSSWSCIHGVERWRNDCGCHSGGHPGWHQKWRKPLREALDDVRDQIIPAYTRKASNYLNDPWAARDDYISLILDRSEDNVNRFLKRHAARSLSAEEKTRVLKLLELQRQTLLMYTSCGWFFDEISGIETVQVMTYASKAMQHAEEVLGLSIEPLFISDLERAPSNLFGNGASVYEQLALPSKVDLTRVGAHYSVSSLFNEYPESTRVFTYRVTREQYERARSGRITLATGRARIRSEFTGEEAIKNFAVLHLADHNISGGLADFHGEEAFLAMREEMRSAFERGDTTEIIHLMGNHFGIHQFSIWHLFRDEQRKVIHQIFEPTEAGIEASFRKIYEDHHPVMNFLSTLHIPIPKPIFLAAEHIVNIDLKRIFEKEDIDAERLKSLIQESNRWGVCLDRATLEFQVSRWATSLMTQVAQDPGNLSLLQRMTDLLKVLDPLSLNLNFWKAQNLYVSLRERLKDEIGQNVNRGDPSAVQWQDEFRKLGAALRIQVTG
jgi:alpha-amylase/alpha-mannosidase (GH57 family)